MLSYTGFTWVQVLTLLVSVVLPAVVALVTQRFASSGLKAITLALLAAVTGFGSELLDAMNSNTHYDLSAGLVNWVTAFVIATVAHYGLLKPTGVTGTNGSVAQAVPVGFGNSRGPGVQTPGVADHAA